MVKYLLIAIVSLGFVLRFYLLGEIPLSMHRDEAFFGYNAYSLLLTGKDISGEVLPLHLESFFMSPAGYSYFVIPFLAIFGLTDMAVRFPSALFGVLTVLLTYFLTKEIFYSNSKSETLNSKQNENSNNLGHKQFKIKNFKLEILALTAAALLAISPWHINLSRVATENVLVTFFIVLGVYLFLIYKRKNKKLFAIASFVSFSLTLLLYQAPRAFLPLFIPVLLLTFNNSRNFLKVKIEYLLFIILIILPVILILTSPDLSWRITSLSIFNHAETRLVINEQLTTDSVQGLPYIISRAFHNKLTAFTLLILENFFKHLSFDFLFLDSGFPDRYRIPHMGLLYLFELPTILVGFYFMLRKYLRTAIFLSVWIIFGIVGSALTSDDIPNLQRVLLILPPLTIFSAFGVLAIYSFVQSKKNKTRAILLFFAMLIIFFNVSYYLVQYYFQGKVYRTWYRQDGYEQMVLEVNRLLTDYKYAEITDRESTPAVFFMYYGKYDPNRLQNETKNLDMIGAGTIPFGKYKFSKEECPVRYEYNELGEANLVGEKGILYVNSGLCKEIPKEANIIKTIKRADNSTAFVLLTL